MVYSLMMVIKPKHFGAFNVVLTLLLNHFSCASVGNTENIKMHGTIVRIYSWNGCVLHLIRYMLFIILL